MAGRVLSASLEDYLEAILVLAEGRGHAHVKGIAERLGVTMPSVTEALHNLAERKLVNHQSYGTVTLTPKGMKVAERVRKRHRVFKTFFEQILGVKPAVAAENACRLEHAVDQTVLDRLASYLEVAKRRPAAGTQAEQQ